MSKSMVRSVKNVTKGYSSVQVKVRNATSNDAWGPSGSDMSDIARMTYNNSGDFYEIMDMLDKRMNDKGKNWRHVLKSLKVLDYCLHEGSELVVTWARKNLFVIKTLREFIYIDEDGKDVGANIRQSAKELTSLILDEDRLRAERHDRKLWKSRVTGLEDGIGDSPGSPALDSRNKRREDRRRQAQEEEDLEYRLALEASKNELEEEKKRRAAVGGDELNDDDLAKAIKLSKEEEELRKRELEDQNAASLFDDTPGPSQPQATGWNQGYQQQGAVDWFGNPINHQPQNTGFLNNAYAQPTGMQPQQTGFQNNGYGFNPYQQQQQQQQPQQTGYQQFQQPQYQQPQQTGFMQPQQTSFGMNNPYSQGNGFNGQPQQQQQQQSSLQPGSNNPWSTQDDSLLNLRPQQTGTNNPFATSFNRPQTASAAKPPTLSTLQEQKTATQFNQSFGSNGMSFSAQNSQQNQQQPLDPHHARLNALLASGEGQDTFGNTGDLRIPAQHTAPGTFINSAGAGLNKLSVNQTGGNPFLTSQYTGMPQQQLPPSQTGPVGFGSSNPFGQQQYSQQQQQQQQQQRQNQGHPGSLIDL